MQDPDQNIACIDNLRKDCWAILARGRAMAWSGPLPVGQAGRSLPKKVSAANSSGISINTPGTSSLLSNPSSSRQIAVVREDNSGDSEVVAYDQDIRETCGLNRVVELPLNTHNQGLGSLEQHTVAVELTETTLAELHNVDDRRELLTTQPPRGEQWTPLLAAKEFDRYIAGTSKGTDIKTFMKLFSPAARTKLPGLISAGYMVSTQNIFRGDILLNAFDEYSKMFTLYEDRIITALDMEMIHETVWLGHRSDRFYSLIDRYEPERLEQNADALDILDKALTGHTENTLHMLHVYDEKTLFKSGKFVRERRQYGSVTLASLVQESIEHLVVIIGEPNVVQWLIGGRVRLLDLSSTKHKKHLPEYGLYYVLPDQHALIRQGMTLYAITNFATYLYLRKSHDNRYAKKFTHRYRSIIRLLQARGINIRNFGLQPETSGGIKTKNRKWAFGRQMQQRELLDQAITGGSALLYELRDKQTTARLRKIERAKIDRSRDPERIQRHLGDTQVQDEIHRSLNTILESLRNQDSVELAVTCLSNLYPYLDDDMLKRTRMQWPQVYILLRLIYINEGHELTKQLLYKTGGVGLQAFANICLAVYADSDLKYAIMTALDYDIAAMGLARWNKFWKAAHEVTRRVYNTPWFLRDLDVPEYLRHGGLVKLAAYMTDHNKLLYIHLLSGRASDLLLADDDYAVKRSKVPEQHRLAEIYPDLDRESLKWDHYVDDEMAKYKPALDAVFSRDKDITPQEVHADFISLAPTGALGEGKADLVNVIADTHRANKRTWLDNITPEQMVDLVNSEPLLKAEAQIKVETGLRSRQIVPGPTKHWMNETIVMRNLEKAIYRSNPEFTLETSEWDILVDHLERMYRTSDMHGGATLASDYADFNFLHTIPDMQKFWRMIRASAEQFTGPGEWAGTNYAGHVVKLCVWLEEALFSMYVRETSTTGTFIHLLRGLWSGWRTTSVINNVFNEVYGKVLSRVCKDILGYDPIELARRNGDDEDARAKSVVASLLYLAMMTYSRLDAQPAKQKIGFTESEYTRVTYAKGVAYNPIARGIASFTSSDLQAPVIDVSPEYVRGTNEALHALIRRGADEERIEMLRTELLMTFSQQSYMEAGIKHVVTLRNWRMLYVPVEQGGFGVTRYGSSEPYKLKTAIPWDTVRPLWELPGSMHHGIASLENHLKDKFTKARITHEHVETVVVDATSIASQNVDTGHNEQWVEYARKQRADHLVKLNAAQCYPTSTSSDYSTTIPGLNALVYKCIDEILSLHPDKVRSYKAPNLEKTLDSYVGKALGLASVTRDILYDLRDVSTNIKLKPWDALARLTGSSVASQQVVNQIGVMTASLSGNYPEALVEAFINRRLKWNRNTYGVMPNFCLPIVDHVHREVLRNYFSGQHTTHEAVDAMLQLITHTNVVIASVWKQHYAQKFKTI
uniref:RNA-directed RNA polymerase n=1 Tax=Lentinula edodes mycovirus HKB TaxID=515670 RepID=B5U9V5_9VIRU|nr:putative RNA-dependent RNA polymerase [Lentinula edodes mycovirus HKB]BAJ21197.1 putative RNA-dependent RNA polymerase [Lentinula edodes mycovirus HKB]